MGKNHRKKYMKKITLLLCDDHNVVREGFRHLLEKSDDIQVVGEAENGRQAVKETKRLNPDVVVLDVSMPLLNGLEATRQISKESPSSKVLILSAYSDDHYVQSAIEAGAAGYLMKGAANDLLEAIREIAAGNVFFSAAVGRRLLKRWQEKFLGERSIGTKVTELTSRQAEILQLIAEGYPNKQIAGLISVGIKTVEKHRQSLMIKLNIHNVANLTRYAVSVGAVPSNRRPQISDELLNPK
jgi:DNA-binding NarL/FixJ family response regulator